MGGYAVAGLPLPYLGLVLIQASNAASLEEALEEAPQQQQEEEKVAGCQACSRSNCATSSRSPRGWRLVAELKGLALG